MEMMHIGIGIVLDIESTFQRQVLMIAAV